MAEIFFMSLKSWLKRCVREQNDEIWKWLFWGHVGSCNGFLEENVTKDAAGFLGDTAWFTQHHVKNLLSSCYVAVTVFEDAAQREVLVTLALGTSVPGVYVACRIGSAASRQGKTFPDSTCDPFAPVNPSHSLLACLLVYFTVTLGIPDWCIPDDSVKIYSRACAMEESCFRKRLLVFKRLCEILHLRHLLWEPLLTTH